MTRKGRLAVFVVVAAVAFGVPGITAAQDNNQPKPSPEQQKAMEAWMKAATPGAAHKALEPTIGSWNVVSTSWQTPGGTPQAGAGIAENSWVLGGRFVKQEFHGEFGGMQFEGLGYTGYDNIRKKYVGTWMDTMSTTVMDSTGTADPSGKTFTSTSTMHDALTGRPMKLRMVTRIVDANKHVMDMFGPGPDGKEFKMMELVYTRK